jgi:hypothetical protein
LLLVLPHTAALPWGCVATTLGLTVTGIQKVVLGPQLLLAKTQTLPPVLLFQVTFTLLVVPPELTTTPGGKVQV